MVDFLIHNSQFIVHNWAYAIVINDKRMFTTVSAEL